MLVGRGSSPPPASLRYSRSTGGSAVSTFFDDVFGSVSCRADFGVESKSLLGDHAFDVVLGVIDVPHIRHHAADSAGHP